MFDAYKSKFSSTIASLASWDVKARTNVFFLSSNNFIKSTSYIAYDLSLSEKDVLKTLVKICDEFQILNDTTNE